MAVVPAGGFLAGGAQGLTLPPIVAFADVPRVQLNDQRERLQGQLQLQVAILLDAAGSGAHLLVQLRALRLGALALLPGLAREGGGGELEAGQPLDQVFGLGGGHLTDGQRGDFLHGRRLGAGFGQTQQRVSREAPFATAFAVAAGARHPDGAEAGLDRGPVAVGEATELVLAVRAKRRRGGGFLLRRLFEHLAEEFLAAAQEVFFQMAEILIGGAAGVMKFAGQTQEQGLPLGGQKGFQSVGALAWR